MDIKKTKKTPPPARKLAAAVLAACLAASCAGAVAGYETAGESASGGASVKSEKTENVAGITDGKSESDHVSVRVISGKKTGLGTEVMEASAETESESSGPSGLKAETYGTVIKLTWEAADGGQSLQVQKNGKAWKETSLSETQESFVYEGAEYGNVYKYRIKSTSAENKKGQKISNTVTVKMLAMPGSLAASQKTYKNKKVKIKWNRAAGADGYELYRKTAGGKWKLVKTFTNGKKTSYTDTVPKTDKKYRYKIRCFKKVSGKKYYSKFQKSQKISVRKYKKNAKKIYKKWYGKLSIAGCSPSLYAARDDSDSQRVTDDLGSALIQEDGDNIYICDHAMQGFRALKNVKKGDTATIKTPAGTTTLKCVRVIKWTTKRSTDIKAKNKIFIRTCEDSSGIYSRITVWEVEKGPGIKRLIRRWHKAKKNMLYESWK